MVIQELILESEILRVENDNDGPQDELEYWKSRAAKLTLLVDQISSPECRMILATLRAAQSRLLRVRFIITSTAKLQAEAAQKDLYRTARTCM